MIDDNFSLNKINSIAKKYYGHKHAKEFNESYPIFSTTTGPLWYRGYFKNPISQKQIDIITAHFQVDHIVVGHTLQTKIRSYYKDKILAIDLSHKKNLPKEKLQTLIKINNKFYVLHQSGEKYELF